MNPSNLIPLSDVDPVVANNLGWEIDSISDKELVTIVKKAIVYSEVTIPKSEYLKARDLDELGEHFYNNIEPKMETDDVMEDFGKLMLSRDLPMNIFGGRNVYENGPHRTYTMYLYTKCHFR